MTCVVLHLCPSVHTKTIESWESLMIAMITNRFEGGFSTWANGNRARCDRSRLRYLNDLTEWALIGPRIRPAKPGGIKGTVVERDIVNRLMYILTIGRRCAALPRDLPPQSTHLLT